jgi:hypothetical protein
VLLAVVVVLLLLLLIERRFTQETQAHIRLSLLLFVQTGTFFPGVYDHNFFDSDLGAWAP